MQPGRLVAVLAWPFGARTLALGVKLPPVHAESENNHNYGIFILTPANRGGYRISERGDGGSG